MAMGFNTCDTKPTLTQARIRQLLNPNIERGTRLLWTLEPRLGFTNGVPPQPRDGVSAELQQAPGTGCGLQTRRG